MARRKTPGKRWLPHAPRVVYVMFACMFFVVGAVDFGPSELGPVGTWDVDVWISICMFTLSAICIAGALIRGPHLKA